MDKNKLVSIIIPTYNRAKILNRTIASCLNQTYAGIELLVVDDNSSDGTEQVVKGYKDSRIKYFFNDSNQGVGAARNIGLHHACGEFIAFLDSDDEWAPEKLAQQLMIFSQVKEIGLVFTNGYNDHSGKLMINAKIPSGIIYNQKKDKCFPLSKLITPPSSWLIPRVVFEAVGDLDIYLGRNGLEDEDYLVRLSRDYPLYFLNENLVTWHSSEHHLSAINVARIKGQEYFLQKYFHLIKQDKEYLFRFYKAMGKDSLSLDRAMSFQYLRKAFFMKPYDLSVFSKLIRLSGARRKND